MGHEVAKRITKQQEIMYMKKIIYKHHNAITRCESPNFKPIKRSAYEIGQLSKYSNVQLFCFLQIQKAQTWLGGCRTRVRRGSTRDMASDAVARASVPRLSFFFFSSDSHQLGSIRTDAARFMPNRFQFAPNRADSAKIGPYLPYRVVAAGDQYGRYGRNRP